MSAALAKRMSLAAAKRKPAALAKRGKTRPTSQARPSLAPPRAEAWHAAASRLLKSYGDRGVFKSHVNEIVSPDSVVYAMKWHRNREYQLVLNRDKRQAIVADVLPALDAKSPIYRDFREFIASFQDGSRAEHRSVDAAKARVVTRFRAGRMLLIFDVLDGDYEYAAQKMLALIHEVYLGFILGPYDSYRVEHLGANPDWGR